MRFFSSVLLFFPRSIFGFAIVFSAQAAPTIEWQPELLNIRQTAGSTVNQTVAVTFSEDADTLAARLTPEFDSWLSVLPVILNDVKAGETIQITLSGIIPGNEPIGTQDGVLQIRSGANQKNLAKPLPLLISVIDGADDGLPPDPGEEGKLTLMGIDSDGDGLRDDVQRYIYLTYPDQPNVQGALTQYALLLQKTVDPNREIGTGRALAHKKGEAMACVHHFMPEEFYEATRRLKAEIINTYDRTKKYLAYDEELIGGIFWLPSLPRDERYKLCDFEIQS